MKGSKYGLGILVAVLGSVWLAAPIFAADSSFSQGFMSSGDMQVGTVVSLAKDGKMVEKASINAPEKMVGVVTEDAVLEVSDGDAREVQVANGGSATALVSDINGRISAGDKVTISPINGVGMKAARGGYVFGVAQADFSTADSVSSQTIKTKSGSSQTVRVGLLPIQVGVVSYEAKTNQSTIMPEFITEVVNAVAGKEVSIVRVSIALIVLLVGAVSIGLILFSAVRSSIISIGRNPLAARAVHRGLLQISFIALGILVAMLTIIYIILVI